MRIAPSILTAKFNDLENEIRSIDNADILHLDIMDGHFVDNISFGPAIANQISKISNLPLDIHLMTSKPLKWIEKFCFENTTNITIHIESDDVDKAIEEIAKKGIAKGLSIRPRTSVDSLKKYLSEIDLVLVMSVEPGFGGQEFIEDSLNKIKNLVNLKNENGYHYQIMVDGGINSSNIQKISNAGADIVVIGSFLFQSTERKELIRRLQNQ